ncbi:spore coat protein [Labedaea rhizosphaerae]|uniref:Spore coat polysaccharide biosynthesis predicted glycosyltransferase SpsG n=1 Tax=Labedaea rhizosphaerae TaxID=598644 RepID=A0A4R6SM67_LABRH|nr:spore coat protein [Labedaea rhizosphaerae]TDQ04971.1 spore coat polysaccharide biosynthesis predicted glycosyltransferase SpsG [Labedaea rhizosphaerae]
MTSLLLRADSGPSIGVGHVVRCLAFAEEAVARGWQVRFDGAVSGWARAAFDELGVEVAPGPLAADVVLVDHYSLGALNVDGLLVSIEDGPFGRRRADVVVDCGLAAVERPDDGSGRVLLGPRYAPLRKSVVRARESRTPSNEIVVVLGGTAPTRPLTTIMRAAASTGAPVRAITSADISVPGVEVEPPRTDLPSVLAGAGLVVSAAGVTLLELCCIGVPTALVLLADNQAMGYRAAIEHGAAVGLGAADALDQAAVAAVLAGLLADDRRRADLAASAATLVDGRGAARVLDATTG